MSWSTLTLWKKAVALSAFGGAAAFVAIVPLYQGNEKFYKKVAMPTLHFLLSAESSQSIGLQAAKCSLIPKCKVEDGPILKSSLLGLEFSNPIGIAAGLDKNGEATSGLLRTGAGYLEIGTVTPLPQSGNAKPRIFTLTKNEGLINRCGFNSKGHKYVKKRLEIRDEKSVLGVNLGKNKESKYPEEDYVKGIIEFSSVADYFTINISSPNTPGLRSLQKRQALENLLDKVLEAREKMLKKPPILLKIAPDLSTEEKADIADVVLRKGKEIDGLIVSNTTITRPAFLKSPNESESGGLSGQPLKQISTQAIADMYRLTQGRLPIVGVGGVASGADAYEKIKAGACLIQVYSALAFQGPPVIGKIKRELKELLIADKYSNVQEAVGSNSI